MGPAMEVDFAAEALAHERARHAALLQRDLEGLERLLGDDLVYIHSSSVEDDKRAIIEAQRTGKVKYRQISISQSQLRTFGPVAIISGTVHVDVTVDDVDMHLNMKFHSVWCKRPSGALEYVSWQATRIPDPD